MIKFGKKLKKVGRTLVDPKQVEKNKRDIKYIAIHCAATKPSMVVPIERVREWHLKRGFNDVGYHYYIRRSGVVEFGRPIDVLGAHVADYNSVSIGICYEGGINEQGKAEDNRTDDQMKTMEILVKQLLNHYPAAIVQGHRDFPGVRKDCPSFEVRTWLENITR